MSDHVITALDPLYTSRGARRAVCTCGWASEEQESAGKATIAGWQHVHSAPKPEPETSRG